ncbi:LamG-like jellyroll fold domain-containing protein [uncultured Thiodictyon sp.]|uniref:LamG-like jellyroll fold domain-containing protein n=1 Tax=uncultured Thiodictyon sp. TaxID=1846217 RepID=UPI00341EEA3A
MQGANGSASFTDASLAARTITAEGAPHITSDVGPWSSGGSAVFDGSSDGLYTNGDSSDFASGTGDFTVEALVRPSSVSGIRCLFDLRPYGQGAYPLLYLNGNQPTCFVDSANMTAGGSVGTDEFALVSWRRTNGLSSLWVNETQVASVADTHAYYAGYDRPYIARGFDGYRFAGHIAGVRFTRVARPIVYPAAPWPAFGAIPAKPLGQYAIEVAYTGLVDLRYYAPDGSNLPDLTNTVDVP